MELTNKKILITGGAGAIGSRLCEGLIDRGCTDITVLDDLSSGFIDNLPEEGVEFIEGSIVNDTVLDQIFSRGIEVVFHLAAHFANQNSVEHPEEDLLVNGMGTLKLLEYAAKYKVQKFVYASSSCVYGNQEGELTEDMTDLKGDTPYAITKLLGEKYCLFFHDYHHVPVTILRYFNSFGRGERPGKYRNVIPNFIATALQGESLLITGDGTETRTFTHIDDVVEGTILSAESEKTAGNIYNIGSAKEVRTNDLALLINTLTKNTAPIRFTERRPWDTITRRRANIDKAQREFGYEAPHSLEEGIAETIEWFKSKKIV